MFRRSVLIALLAAGCTDKSLAPREVTDAITATRMKVDLDYLADDASDGRIPGSVGHDQVRDYLIDQLETIGLMPLGPDDGWVHTFEHVAREGHYVPVEGGGARQSTDTIGQNLIGVLPGTDPDRSEEYIVLMAHYDHLGVSPNGEEVFNGAFDDGSGVVALLELARALADARRKPERSVIFLITDSEEAGLQGAEAWVDAPTVGTEDVVAAISVDPIGRPVLPDYWPLIVMGAERSPELREVMREVAPRYETDEGPSQQVRFLARDMLVGFASDQDAFLEADLPATWFNSAGVSFYHTLDDTADTMDYRPLRAQTRWLAHALYAIDAHEGRFDTIATPAWDAVALEDAVGFFAGMLESSELDDDERERVQAFVDTMQPAADAGTADVLDDPNTAILTGLLMMFDLAREHVGPIPPPFPDDE